MLRSNSILTSFGLIQLVFIIFLFSGRGSLRWRSMLLRWLTGLLHINCCFLFIVEITSDSSLKIDRGGPRESSVCSIAACLNQQGKIITLTAPPKWLLTFWKGDKLRRISFNNNNVCKERLRQSARYSTPVKN